MMKMYTSEKMVKLETDMTPRTAGNFNFYISNLQSEVYFEMGDRCINAKSLLGILSLALREDNIINIKIENIESVENAKRDLKKVRTFFEYEIGTK